jgi:hypothetical protein
MKRLLVLSSLVFWLFAGCKKETNSVLTPARDLSGTWITPLKVTFHIKTDFCTPGLADVATEQRLVTWKITNINDTSVNIEQTFTRSNFTVINPACGGSSGYTPDVSPNFYKGILSSNTLTVLSGKNIVGIFNFTTTQMEGNWNDSWCIAFCQEVYTVNKEWRTMKQ